MIVCGACGFSQVMQKAYADDLTITKVTLSIFNSDKTTTPQSKENDPNTYLTKFQNTTTPYLTYYLQAKINTDPSDAVVDDSISSQLKWYVDGVEIDFSENSYNDSNSEFTANKVTSLAILFTPKLPTTFNLSCKITYAGRTFDSSQETPIYLESEYAVPTKVTIENDKNLQQTYESFENITLTAKLDPEKDQYINKNSNVFTFTWYKNNTDVVNIIQSNESSVITITQDILENKIGETKFIVLVKGGGINENQPLEQSVVVKLVNQSGYQIEIITTDGDLVQTIGEENTPVNFRAIITPIPEEYTVSWYVLNANSSIYEKQKLEAKADTRLFTFKVSNKQAGQYRVFAKLTVDKQDVFSNLTNIKILKKETEIPSTVTISEKKFNNKNTGVEGFTLSVDIDVEQYSIDAQDIIWYVNGDKIRDSETGSQSSGTQFTFTPPVAGEYRIDVRLKLSDGSEKFWGYQMVNAKSTTVNLMWFYIALSITLLIIICVLSIVISNKLREKIW